MFLPGNLRRVKIAAQIVDNVINVPISVKPVPLSRANIPTIIVTIIINRNDMVAKKIGPDNNHDLSVFFLFHILQY